MHTRSSAGEHAPPLPRDPFLWTGWRPNGAAVLRLGRVQAGRLEIFSGRRGQKNAMNRDSPGRRAFLARIFPRDKIVELAIAHPMVRVLGFGRFPRASIELCENVGTEKHFFGSKSKISKSFVLLSKNYTSSYPVGAAVIAMTSGSLTSPQTYKADPVLWSRGSARLRGACPALVRQLLSAGHRQCGEGTDTLTQPPPLQPLFRQTPLAAHCTAHSRSALMVWPAHSTPLPHFTPLVPVGWCTEPPTPPLPPSPFCPHPRPPLVRPPAPLPFPCSTPSDSYIPPPQLEGGACTARSHQRPLDSPPPPSHTHSLRGLHKLRDRHPEG